MIGNADGTFGTAVNSFALGVCSAADDGAVFGSATPLLPMPLTSVSSTSGKPAVSLLQRRIMAAKTRHRPKCAGFHGWSQCCYLPQCGVLPGHGA